ncbi:MAG: hypothetical protein JO297_03750, partial [Nitrososphaeraceae archaeon]|nr:hypothetical protein [Nitrososphaeraceae archaeon]
MIKKLQQATKLTITLAAIITVTAVITPLKPVVFAQSASTNSSNTSTGSNSVKTLRIGYFPNINHA